METECGRWATRSNRPDRGGRQNIHRQASLDVTTVIFPTESNLAGRRRDRSDCITDGSQRRTESDPTK